MLDDLLRRLRFCERAGLRRPRVGFLGLGQETRPLDRHVPLELSLHRGCCELSFGSLLIGPCLRDTGLAGYGGGVRRGQVVDVTRGVLDLLDLQRVHHDAELLHLGVTAVLDLLGDPVPFPDDLLDGEPADDGPQVAGVSFNRLS